MVTHLSVVGFLEDRKESGIHSVLVPSHVTRHEPGTGSGCTQSILGNTSDVIGPAIFSSGILPNEVKIRSSPLELFCGIIHFRGHVGLPNCLTGEVIRKINGTLERERERERGREGEVRSNFLWENKPVFSLDCS